MKDRHIIWSDLSLDFKDWKNELRSEHPHMSEDQLYSLMHEINSDYLQDERRNLSIQLSTSIIVIGDIGRWNGRVMGYKMIESRNIRDCLYSECDYNEWYVDKNGDLRCTAVHHDGRNYYLYRAFKDSATDAQMENLRNKIYNWTATRADISRVTRRLGDDIAKVYGFSISYQKQAAMER